MSHQTLKNQSSTETTVDGKALYLVTAGRKIKCLRCTASSTRTKQQCGRPSLKTSKTQKCQFHGGRATGAKTPEGRKRIAQANYRHGESSKAARRDYSTASANLRRLEDAMYVLGMTSASRTRGRKPAGYMLVRTLDDVRAMVLDLEMHRAGGPLKAL